MHRGLALSSFLLATSLHAQDDYRSAYLSHVEGEVSLQRASEPEPESGSLNVPILPGDRIWTRTSSRAEIRFGSALVVHLAEGAKLDFVAIDSETILRLWSGSAILRIPDVAESTEALRIDSPAGSIRPTREGSYRIDIEGGDAVRLSVERGSAELASSLGTVLVQSGETSFATPSDPPSIPLKFNTARLDEFDRWSESREARRSRTEDIVVRSLPHQVQSYAYDLADHGDWYQEPDYGYVWYPRVSVGWAPYTYGHWGYTYYGHTWISSEPWGWAPYHYGRWGFGHRGWYWIPGATWGPAWVSFAIGPTWVGWSPLGYYNRPVFGFNSYFGGYGSGYYRHGGWDHHRGGWNVCSRDDFRSGVVTRAGYRKLKPESLRASVDNARFVDEVSSLDRELNPRGSGGRAAVPRSARDLETSSGGREARGRSEEALRGFRERATSSSPRVIDDRARTASRRGERPSEVSDVMRGAREIQSTSDGRERPARESVESTRRDATSRSIEREPRGFAERSRATETSEAFRSAPTAAPRAQRESRERFERARERATPILPSREVPSIRSTSPSPTRSSRAPRESSGTRQAAPRTRTPEMRVPEMRTEPRGRVERAQPQQTQRSSRRMGEAPARASGGSGRSSRERSPSVGARDSGGRGGAAAQRSRGSQSSRGGSARSRSNQN